MELNLEGLEMQKLNIPMDRAQRLDKENEIFCPVFMFAPRVMVNKMLKMGHFWYFLLVTAKNQSWAKYLVHQNICR